jgi:hypothetical protein
MRSNPIEEEEHNIRVAGYAELVRKDKIRKDISTIRIAFLGRLENIRGFADREKPNRKEILALVGEIQEALGSLEDDLL